MTARARLLLDLALFAALLVAYNPSWTGLAVHEWLCAAATVPLLFHLVVNWEWVAQVARRFTERLRMTSRLNLVVDAALFLAAVGVMLSGLMVSQSIATVLGVAIVPSGVWSEVHSLTADATIALLLVHFVLHWRWVATTARRLARPPAADAVPAPAAQLPAAAALVPVAAASTGRPSTRP